MGAGKKKNRISKHVIQAQERETQERTAATGPGIAAAPVTPVVASASKKKPLKKKKKHSVKNPMEAASYLSLWKLQQTTPQDGASVWKFNKNTQSWLFRHMYESDKVSKTTFATLMDYLVSVKSVPLRQRLCENAVHRAQRYKNWEKEQAETTESSTQGDSKVTDTKSSLPSSTNTPQGGDDDDEIMEEQEAWTKLGAHDKRKEYKRTRKVLDTLKQQQNSNSETTIASENQTDS